MTRLLLSIFLVLLGTTPALAQLSVNSAFSQSNIAAGQASSLTITLRNPSGTALNVPALTISPIGVDSATSSVLQVQNSAVVGGSSVSLATSCRATSVTRIDGNRGIRLAPLTLNAGASCTISLPFIGSIGVVDSNRVVTITPKAAAVSSGSAAVSVNFTASNSVSLWNNFQISKGSSPKYVPAGDPVFFEIQINNFAGQALNALMVSDRLQSNSAMVTLPGWTGSTGLPAWGGTNTSQPAILGGCTMAGVSGTTSHPVFTVNNLPLNGTCMLGFWGALPKDAVENATPINSLELGSVSWVSPSGFTVANASQASTQVLVIAPLAISAAFSPANAAEGTPVTLSFILANSSAGTVGNLAFSTALPLTASGNQLRVASPANASTTCSGGSVTAVAGGSTISLSGGSLPARTINPAIVGKNQASTCTVSLQVVGAADTYRLALPRQALSGSGNYAVDGSAYTPRSSALTAPAPASLTYNLALGASKAFAPAAIGDGGRSTVTVNLSNTGSAALSNLAVNDPLPPYMTVASPANASSTCSGASVNAVPGAASVSMAGGSLPTASSCQLVFDVIGSGAAPWVNTIAPGGVTADGGIQNFLPISATLANSTPPAVAVSTSLSPATLAMPGQSSVLTIQLQNKSPVALNNLRLSDYFTRNGTATAAPSGMQLLSPPSLSSTCSGAVLTAASDAGSFSMSGASLPFGGTCTITANVTSTKVGTVINAIPVQAVASDEGVSNPTGATASLSAGGRIDVLKSFSPALVRPGHVARLQLALSHVTPLSLDNLALTDNLPAGLVVATPANALTSCTGGVLTASAGQVRLSGAAMPAAAPGLPSRCSVEVDVVAGAEGRYRNTLNVGEVSGSFEGGPASNWVAASAGLEVRSAVLLFKSFVPAVVGRMTPSTATITLGNGNAIGLTALRLVDTLPPKLVPAPVPNAMTTCPGGSVTVDALAGTIALTGATLPAAGSCKVKVDVVSNVAGTYVNSIAAHALQDGEGVSNDLPASATLTVLQPPTLAERFSAPQIRRGGVSTLILALGNDNSTGLILAAELADALPAGVTVAAIPNLAGSCDLAQVSAAAGAGVIRYASGASLPARGCTIRVDVTAAEEGVYNNVIPAGALLTAAGSNTLPATASLTVNPLGAISGKVFLDSASAPNGVYDSSKAGIANVVLRLTGSSYGPDGVAGGGDDVPVRLQTVTDVGGSYSFTGLAAGQYTVTLPHHPPDTTTGITSAGPVLGGGGGSSGTASGVAAWPSSVSGIVLLSDDSGHTASSAGNHFAALAPASLAGRVYVDTNNNGLVDADEAGIAGVTVRLAGVDWHGKPLTRSLLTAADGRYRFDGLPPSSPAGYTLTEIQPDGYPDGKTSLPRGRPGHPGYPDHPGAAKPTGAGGADSIGGIVVLAGDVLADYNFGELADPVLRRPIINGYVYLNTDHSGIRPQEAARAGLSGWTVQLTQNGTLVCSAHSDAQGFYQFDNLHCPGYQYSGLPTGGGIDITFLSNGNVAPATAHSGNGRGDVSAVGKIMGIQLLPDDQVVEQNLPLDPSGVVYDARTRQPVAGATVTLSGPAGFDAARHLVGGQASQVTGTDGFYQFLLHAGFPPGVYRLAVLGPPPYEAGTATSMPACHGSLTVAAAPLPALVQASNGAPDGAVPLANPAACVGIVAGGATSTQYYLGFGLSASSAPILNNHLPVDKAADGVLTVFKSTPMVRAARGDLVPYVITVTNNKTYPVSAVNLVDQMPPGFKYRRGSASLEHIPLEPVMEGRGLSWRGQNFLASEKKTFRLILVVGAGVEPGDYINQAWAVSMDKRLLSGIAQASTRVMAEPTLDCPDLLGKVFEDRNGNGYQDPGEPGLAGVRLVTPRGLLIQGDEQGRFHVPCPELPNQDRGSNLVLKLDTRSLPEGYRLSTDNPATVHLTRGKAGKISFGALRYRLFRLSLADAAFVPGLGDLLPQWDVQLDLLVERLQEAPSIVQLHYAVSGHEQARRPALPMLRLRALRERLMARWQAAQGPYLLRVEIDPMR